MFQNVLIGIDDAAGGRDAIALARALAPSAVYTLVHVYPTEPLLRPEGALGWEDVLAAESEDMLAGLGLEGARLVTVGDRSPARALQAEAQRRDADLLVLAAARHGVLGRLFLGSVARGVLHGAPCPVAVAPRGYSATSPISRIGVAFDGGAESRLALGAAAAVAERAGGTLEVVWGVPSANLYEPGWAYSPDYGVYVEAAEKTARQELEAALAPLAVPATATVERGSVGSVLEALAERSDLVVVGSRGYGPARRVLLGSVSSWVVHHATSPVLVVPRGAEVESESSSEEVSATALPV
jgi:nucleotide-binding universal stress UspA family protein